MEKWYSANQLIFFTLHYSWVENWILDETPESQKVMSFTNWVHKKYSINPFWQRIEKVKSDSLKNDLIFKKTLNAAIFHKFRMMITEFWSKNFLQVQAPIISGFCSMKNVKQEKIEMVKFYESWKKGWSKRRKYIFLKPIWIETTPILINVSSQALKKDFSVILFWKYFLRNKNFVVLKNLL